MKIQKKLFSLLTTSGLCYFRTIWTLFNVIIEHKMSKNVKYDDLKFSLLHLLEYGLTCTPLNKTLRQLNVRS